MKTILCLIAASTLLCGCAGTYFTFDQARRVEVGMTEAELQNTMGSPNLVTARGNNCIWVYSFADGFGRARSVSYVLSGGKVIEVPCIPFK